MLLYHYTSLAGAVGILQSSSIWASSIRHLNDSSELRYAVDLAHDVFSVDTAYSDSDRAFWFSGLTEGTSYVACFSAVPDQLSQWRAYSGPAAGVSLGFDSEALERAVSQAGYRLRPCIYAPEQQRALLLSAKGNGDARTVATAIVRHAPSIKHPSFREEAEWRLISGLPPAAEASPTPEFRQVGSMLLPYRVVRFPSLTHPDSPLRAVIVGPSPFPEENAFSLQLLLATLDSSLPVSISAAPYRTR